jgi:2-methylcitrate dehydratase PrpD
MKTKRAQHDNTAKEIARFVTQFHLRNVPDSIRQLAKLHILDGFATMVGGVNENASRLLRRHFLKQRGKQESTIIGTGLRTTAKQAAFANGVQAHVLDYDDAQMATLPSRPAGQQVHPTAPVLASALAIAEARHLSGAALLASYIAGVEVACRLGDAIDPVHYLDGFHPTGTLGVFGAAAACAHLLRLGVTQTLWSLGIAGTFASGLRANRGTMAKALNAGHAAQSGVLAAALAQTGFTASENIFDDPMGFFSAAAKNKLDKRLLRFGKPLFFKTPGLAIKLYPCPGTLHPMLDVLLDLVKRHDVHPDQVRKIRIAMAPEATLPLVYDHPEDGLQAKFSLPFTTAIAIAEGEVGLRQFTDERVANARIKRLMQKVELIRRAPTKNNRTSSESSVEIVLSDGRMLCGHAVIARGHPKLPASQQDLEDKFRQCAQGTLSARSIDRFLADLWTLEHVASLPIWLGPLRPSRR